MILKCFVVFDSKANLYQGPYFSRSSAEMIRNFSYVAAMDTSSVFHKYGADYTLFEVGQFDDATGVISCENSLAFINHGNMLTLGAAYIAADEAAKRAALVSKEDV